MNYCEVRINTSISLTDTIFNILDDAKTENIKIVDLKKDEISQKKLKVKPKNIVEKKQDEGIGLSIKDHKNLNKTIDLAVIIKKLKKIRDEELNNNKEKSLKKNKEIIKLNETIDLAEDLFKKELLDL